MNLRGYATATRIDGYIRTYGGQKVTGTRPNRRAIVLVDDEPNILRALRRELLFALGSKGVTVLTARSGQECLAILADQHDSVTLVISDFRMPEMTGGELVERVSTTYPDIALMLLTAYSDSAELTPGASAVLSGCLMKPWDVDDLVARIETVLEPEEAIARPA